MLLKNQELKQNQPGGNSPAQQSRVEDDTPLASSPAENFGVKLKAIRRELREEYLQPHTKPWIIGFSGGKDSTLLAHLTIECLLAIPPDERKRRVYLVCNDTLVESPVFQEFVNHLLAHISDNLEALRIPVEVVRTSPRIEESFWVNMLGKGYPAPNRSFRWCTDRMKIRPTSRFIRDQVSHYGEAVLLLGVRRAESAARAANIAKHSARAEGRLTPHGDHKGCWIFTPIKELTTDEVWIALLKSRPPWGGSYKELIQLYKDAAGGECPFVLSKTDAPSCGTSSARFGCWTCTVVEKDNAIQSLIASGHEHLEPLALFRNRLKQMSEAPQFRSKIRRNGQPGLGPLTYDARKMLLQELLATQDQVGMQLISEVEVRLIREQWLQDQAEERMRSMEKLSEMVENQTKENNA
jgi:DNA sulfur modification protein DndC